MKFDSVAAVLNSLTKFDATTRKLKRQYGIQLAVTKTRFFPWYVVTKCDTHNGNWIFGIDSASYPISLMLHDCITYDINMTHLWWMGVAKSRYQFITSSWDFLSMITPWFVSVIGNANVGMCYLILRRVIRRKGFTVNIYIESVLINGAK